MRSRATLLVREVAERQSEQRADVSAERIVVACPRPVHEISERVHRLSPRVPLTLAVTLRDVVPHAVLPPLRPGQFAPIAARSAGSATYCSMYPHDMQMCRSGTTFFQNETANLFMGPRAPALGGPTRTSVDWHFGHFPDFMSHPWVCESDPSAQRPRFSRGAHDRTSHRRQQTLV